MDKRWESFEFGTFFNQEHGQDKIIDLDGVRENVEYEVRRKIMYEKHFEFFF